ncbi:MAG TPA: MarP family serine protease [Flexivirga sp.]|uniref:MarP family serine protease n=1 Tax=Flexivirga sp. TaxID=1962927 RepID=UPI002C90D539|nr:MarP family serine protease [Flexivirga sp.]HWC22786.1 MarP family serine protease [Flexivirga sp.]
MISGAAALDLVLVLVLIGYAIGHYRAGFVASVLSLAGFLAGGFLGLWLLPGLLNRWSATADSALGQGLLLVMGVLTLATVGQVAGAHAGGRLRSRLRFQPARTADSVLGAVAGVLVAATLAWFVAGAVQGTLPTSASEAIAHSRVLRGVDRIMPSQADRFFAGVRQMVDDRGMPDLYAGPIAPVGPPEPGVLHARGVAGAAGSIVKVTGDADGCGREQEGTGWVVAPHRVVTNAHVVAGVDHPVVQVGGTGRSYPATPVAFSQDRDIAVLAVPGLVARPLPTGAELSRGDAAVVAGFPENGPYRLDGARINARLLALGTNIYGQPAAAREVYAITGRVEPGNSGGPLLSSTGRVVGTVFARSARGAPTGYALTLAESRPVVEDAAHSTTPVPTGACVG